MCVDMCAHGFASTVYVLENETEKFETPMMHIHILL